MMNNDLHLTIGMLWHTFGHDNLGIDALSRSNAYILRRAANSLGVGVNFLALGGCPKPIVPDLPADIMIGSATHLRDMVTGRSGLYSDIRRCDLVIDIGEGDSFADLYGRRRFIGHCVTKGLVLALGKPLILAPQTIGPFEQPLHRWMATRILDRAAVVLTRDHLSTNYLKFLGVRAPMDEVIDVAFALDFTPAPKKETTIRIGINVSGLLYHGGYTGRNELGLTIDYARLTREMVAAFLSRPGVEVNLFAHVAGGGGPDDDGPAIASLGRDFPSAQIMPIFPTSIAAKSWMSGLDFVVSARMHACIGAYSAGVPVVPIAYSRKFNGLFGTLAYPYFIDAKASDHDLALNTVMQWFDDRPKLREAINTGTPIIATRLERYEAMIRNLLNTLLPITGEAA